MTTEVKRSQWAGTGTIRTKTLPPKQKLEIYKITNTKTDNKGILLSEKVATQPTKTNLTQSGFTQEHRRLKFYLA